MKERAHYWVLAVLLAIVAWAAWDISSELHLANDRHLIAYCGRVLR